MDISVALLYEGRQSKGKAPSELLKNYNVNAFNCSFLELSKKWVKDITDHEIPVFVYTINKEKDMKKMLRIGVSGIFTDKPNVLKQVVDNMWETK